MTWTSLPVLHAGDPATDTPADVHAFIGDLLLRWYTKLSGRIELELMSQPMDLEQAVITAWHRTADALPGTRDIIDRHRDRPTDDTMAVMLSKAAAKEHLLLAVMAGKGNEGDVSTIATGALIEAAARSTYVRSDLVEIDRAARPTFFDRIKAAFAS